MSGESPGVDVPDRPRSDPDGCDIPVVVESQGDVPLVGGERELTFLRAALPRAADGNSGAVLVAGKSGVGKSRLVRALLDEAPPPEALAAGAVCRPPPTTRCGGHPTSDRSTCTAPPCGTPRPSATGTRTPGSRCRPGTRRSRELDHPDAKPAHVVRFGSQVDIKGVIAPSEDANRTIRYLTKYLTKAVSETHADPDHPDEAYEAHIDRLHAEVLYLPCSETCANWLRFGIQPKDPGPGLAPGMCVSKAHDRENLGLGGRRVQVSRNWSGKTLAQHRADRAEVVRQVLEASGITPPERDRWSADVLTDDGRRRFVWEDMPTDDADYIDVVMTTIAEQQRWRTEYQTARERWDATRASPPEPVDSRSATHPGPTAARGRPDPTTSSSSSRQPAAHRSPDWPSRVSEAKSRSDTAGALDGQTGDLTLQLAGGRGTPATNTREMNHLEKILLTAGRGRRRARRSGSARCTT